MLGAVLVVSAFTLYRSPDFEAAQAAMDRETVDCLAHRISRDEKNNIARYTALHQNENLRPIFTALLSRCIVRDDQWDRRPQLVAGARQTLAQDGEFRRMLASGTMELARRP